MKVVIIGYGNPLRGDDGVGWHVAGQLSDLADRSPGVQVIAAHQLTPELAATLAEANLAVFIDAECSRQAGEVTRQSVLPDPASGAAHAMTHSLTPQRLLATARDLFGGAPPAVLFTVAGRCFDHAEGLTPVVERACEKVVHQVREMVGCLAVDEQVHEDRPREAYGYA